MSQETKLVKFNAMKYAVAECYSIDEIATLRNQAEAYRYALEQAKQSPEIIRQACEIKLRAERRAGQLLREMKKNQGGRPLKNRSQLGTGLEKLKDLGISKNESSRWQTDFRVRIVLSDTV